MPVIIVAVLIHRYRRNDSVGEVVEGRPVGVEGAPDRVNGSDDLAFMVRSKSRYELPDTFEIHANAPGINESAVFAVFAALFASPFI